MGLMGRGTETFNVCCEGAQSREEGLLRARTHRTRESERCTCCRSSERVAAADCVARATENVCQGAFHERGSAASVSCRLGEFAPTAAVLSAVRWQTSPSRGVAPGDHGL